jgi:hypothetical protein
MPFIATRQRVISRSTPILGFTGIAMVYNAVFDASTLSANSSGLYILPSGTIVTKSTTDPTKVKAYAGLGTNTNEQQTVTITGGPTGGTFTLTFGGQTTAAIAYNATAAQVLAALELLTSIGQGNMTATGGALPGSAVVVTFTNELGNEAQVAMTATSSLTGGTTPAVAVTRSTPGSTGEAIYGIYAGPDKDFFGNTAQQDDEPIAIHNSYTVFDTSLLQNWGEYGELAIQALPLCQFVGA